MKAVSIQGEAFRPPIKRAGGRQLIVGSPAEFDQLTDDYVESCEHADEPLTVIGLALFLGFNSRRTLSDYGRRKGFENSVARARLIIEHHHVQVCLTGKPAQVRGAIWYLKSAFRYRTG